jgi:magnesium chelatase subunit D
LEFESDPASFRARFQKGNDDLSKNILRARKILPTIQISAEARAVAANLAISAGVAGHRADLALCLVARAKAAWEGGSPVIDGNWVRKVEDLVVPERRRVTGERKVLKTLPAEIIPIKEDRPEEGGEPLYIMSAPEVPPEWKEDNLSPDDKMALQVFQIGEKFSVITPKAPREVGPREQKGHRSFRETLKSRGRAFRTTARRLGRPLSLSATLRAAAPHQRERLAQEKLHGILADSVAGTTPGRVILKPADFREKVYRLKTGRLVVFVVDSSGSIGTLYRMEEAKAAAMSLLTDAYQKRDRVSVITFYGSKAELLLPPTNSPDLAGRLLTNLPSGGKTPLSAALALTHKLLKMERAKDPMVSPFVILMTDGRPNIPLDPKKEPWQEVLRFADLLAMDPLLNFLLIDTDRGAYNDFKLTKELAERLNAPKISLEELREGRLEKWLNSG